LKVCCNYNHASLGQLFRHIVVASRQLCITEDMAPTSDWPPPYLGNIDDNEEVYNVRFRLLFDTGGARS
jgi:hypothetical protein